MTDDLYSSVANIYDRLNGDVDYEAWADYIAREIKARSTVPTVLGLDLACGTGRMTFALRERGYDMTGVDSSPEMLAVAADVCQSEKIDDILWLCQDMTGFELYGTVDFAVCCLDSINHLTRPGDAAKCFSLVHNYLVPDGLFFFDLNTPKKFETVYGDNAYVLEDGSSLVAWQNFYDPKRKICDFYISTFTENADGTYDRRDSVLRERCYTERSVKRLLSDAGFEIIFISSDFTENPPSPDADRWYILARCKK